MLFVNLPMEDTTKRAKSGGRKKGTPNKATAGLRDAVSGFVTDNFEEFVRCWRSIENPKDQADIYIKAAKFVIPALQSVAITDTKASDKSVEQKLLELSEEC